MTTRDDFRPSLLQTAARLGRARVERDERVRVTPEGGGSVIVTINLTGRDDVETIPVSIPGFGVQVLEGVGLTRWNNTAASTANLPHMKIAMLSGSESEEYAAGSTQGMASREWRTDRWEVYDGAILPGTFERLALQVDVGGADGTGQRIVLRIFTVPQIRPVPVAPPPPQGLPVIHAFDGEPITPNFGFVSPGTLYSDEDGQLVYGDDLASGRNRYADGVLLGQGYGSEVRRGPIYARKRRMFGMIRVDDPAATASLFIALRAGSSYHEVKRIDSNTFVDSGGVTRTMLPITQSGVSLRDPIWLPEGDIKLIYSIDTTNIAGQIWLSFY